MTMPKVARDRAEEVWIEKTYYKTEDKFPTVLRRSQVVEMEVAMISPLENALEEVQLKTKELAALELKYQSLEKTTQDVSTNALSKALDAVVDSPTNAGITAYRQLFFDPEYVSGNPDRVELIDKLRAAVDEQVCVLGELKLPQG
ncbi:Deoxycytidine kinase 1 [Marasmius tenuissimus]|uniref:Deoxycytidine kinase 1 n=1 Tax=Marasmius tenuissimus TaxID=585030 RepID=A0ABR3AFX1_9AGAR